MASQITNYQCPNCTGPLRFAGTSGQLECEHCDSRFEISVIEQLYADKEQAAAFAGTEPQWDPSASVGTWGAEEAAHMRSYTCPSCAAELICDDTTAATSCPYCGNPTVVPGQFTGQLKPDYVIPFKLDKDAAMEGLKRHYKGKKFLPKSFIKDNHIQDIKGIYVPFWLFDARSDGDIKYTGTKVHKHISGDEEVTVTEYYDVFRKGSISFSKIPVDGSKKMPDAHMDAIEPYDYSELKTFSSAYLPGFMADKYDMDADVCSQRANVRIKASTQDAFAATAKGYHSLTVDRSAIDIHGGDIKYALMPVWMLNSKWDGKDFLFAMNGQTGKFIGDLPMSWGKFWATFAAIALSLMALFSLIYFMF
jgi:DNA-directed RNA polymerase subunit RPC12/RpoP